MNPKIFWLGGLVVFVLAAALYLGSGSGPDAQKAESAPDRTGLARTESQPAAAPRLQKESAGAQAEPHENGKGNGSTAATKPAQKDPRLLAQERAFIARLFALPGPGAGEQERLFWEESPVKDQLYPDGHPCAGQPLDSTSPETLTAAGRAALSEVIGAIPDVDVPQCLYQGNWPFFSLNQACSGMNREDPESVAHCELFLQSAHQDPKAYPATLWLPCTGEGAQQTTRRQYYEGLLAAQVQQIFSGPRCQF